MLEQPSIYNPSLENNKVFCWIMHCDLFQHIEIILPHIYPGKVGSYKQTLIQQITHAAFHPFVARQHFLAIFTSSYKVL